MAVGSVDTMVFFGYLFVGVHWLRFNCSFQSVQCCLRRVVDVFYIVNQCHIVNDFAVCASFVLIGHFVVSVT